MKELKIKLLSLAAVCALSLGLLAAPPLASTARAGGTAGPDGLPANGTYQDGAGGAVHFGRYPQTQYGPTSGGAPPGVLNTDYIEATNTRIIVGQYYYLCDPGQYRVLSITDNDIYLLSEKALQARTYDADNNDWRLSDIKAWLNDNTTGFSTFSSPEASVITSDGMLLLEEGELASYFSVVANQAASVTDYVDYVVGYGTAQNKGTWWLRSPGSHDRNVLTVFADGSVNNFLVDVRNAVRPAFKIDRSSVLFTSVSSSAGAPGVSSTLAAFTPPATPRKLTIIDNGFSNGFAITDATSTGAAGGSTTTLNYSGAAIDTSNFIRVKFVNDASPTQIAYTAVPVSGISAAGGSFTLSLPAGMPAGTYTCYAWVEQGNAAGLTQIGSTPDTFTLTVTAPVRKLTNVPKTGDDFPFGWLALAFAGLVLGAALQLRKAHRISPR